MNVSPLLSAFAPPPQGACSKSEAEGTKSGGRRGGDEKEGEGRFPYFSFFPVGGGGGRGDPSGVKEEEGGILPLLFSSCTNGAPSPLSPCVCLQRPPFFLFHFVTLFYFCRHQRRRCIGTKKEKKVDLIPCSHSKRPLFFSPLCCTMQ